MTKASKSTWKRYRFDEMAYEVKDRVEDPRTSGFKRYVGLKHLDSGSLKIWRWGSTQDVKKTKYLFKSGDIIFGRRNAYLRRISVADFDGVCSAHAMVLRSQPEVALPEFLPLFMQTDTFWRAALRNSAGSLSPTINWSNIAKEEFALPPLEEQWRIVEVLQAVRKVIEDFKKTASAIDECKLSFLSKFMSGPIKSFRNAYLFMKLGDIATVGTGGTPRRSKGEYWGGSIPWMSSGEIHSQKITHTRETITKLGYESSNATWFPKGTVMLAMNGQGKTRGTVAILEVPMTCNQSLAGIVVDENKILAEYLFQYLQGQYESLRNMTGSNSRNGLNLTLIRGIKIPVPDLEYQAFCLVSLRSLDRVKDQIIGRISAAISLYQTIINSTLGC